MVGLYWLIALQVVKGVFQAQADAQQAAAMDDLAVTKEIQAEIARTNAAFVAKQQLKRGRQEALQRRKQSGKTIAQEVARGAVSGVEVGTGSPMMRIASRIEQDEKNATRAYINAKAAAFQAEAQGRSQEASFLTQARQLRTQADQLRQLAPLKIITGGMQGSAQYTQITGETPWANIDWFASEGQPNNVWSGEGME